MATPQNYLRLKTGLQLEDPGAGTKVTTISAASALAASYNVVLPTAAAAHDSSPLVISTTGDCSWSELPFDSVMSGWAAYGGEADYWTYTRSSLTFVVEKSGVGYIKGKRVVFAAGQSVVITAGIANYVGVNTNGTVFVASSPDFSDNFYLFEVFDDNTSTYPNGFIVKKENHAIDMNRSISSFLHNNIGTVIRGSGAQLVLHAANTDPRIDITGDTVEDHGNATTFATQSPATIRFWYVMNDGTTWREYGSATATFPVAFYNTTSNAVEVVAVNNRRVVYRMYVTADSLQSSAPTFVAVINRQTTPYTSLGNANTAINAGLITATATPFQSLEWCQLGYVVMNLAGGLPVIEQITIQKTTFNAQFSGGTGVVSSHLTLGDLDGGQHRLGGHQYAAQRNETTIDATSAENDTANPGYRSGALWTNTTDKNVQVCTSSTGTAVWPKILLYDSATHNTGYKPSDSSGKTYSTTIGDGAGAAATGVGGTYLGYAAGASVTSGARNVCIGYASDSGSTVASGIAIGDTAVVSANSAIAIGKSAAVTGAEGIAIGTSLSSGANNVRIGVATVTDNYFNGNVHFNGGSTNSNVPTIMANTYSTTLTDGSQLQLTKSQNTTVGTLTKTLTGDVLGQLSFSGVTSGSTRNTPAYIQCRQTADSGATYSPAMIEFQTNSATGTAVPLQITNSILYLNQGTGDGAYRSIALNGGNSNGSLWTWGPSGDGSQDTVNLGYNYYKYGSAAAIIGNSGGRTSNVVVGYGTIDLQTSTAVNTAPTSRVTIAIDGKTTVTGNMAVTGFASLGTGSSGIATKRLTGTVNAVAGATTTVAHGLTASKILFVMVNIAGANGWYMPNRYEQSVILQYMAYWDATNVALITGSGATAEILSKGFVAVVWYEA